MLGTSFPPVRSMAWRMARATALNADSALCSRSLLRTHLVCMVEGDFLPVVIVLSTQDVDVECSARGDGEGVEDVWDHFGGEFADFFALEVEFCDAVGAGADVDDGAGEGFVERGKGGSVALDSANFTQRLLERGAEGDGAVLCLANFE